MIHLCLSAYGGSKLVAFDIGLCDERNAPLWKQLEDGYSLSVKDPFGLLAEDPGGTYPQWEPVTLTAATEGEQYKTLYCYVNDVLAGTFEWENGVYRFTLPAPGVHCRVLVTPEEQK